MTLTRGGGDVSDVMGWYVSIPWLRRLLMSELVSCILVTRNRNRFFPQALRCYLAQTWEPRELIVVDDGDEPVGPLCEGIPGVRYLRLDRVTPTGTKLNLGIDVAGGAILQKIDDDDYYRPEFLATAASSLLAGAWRRAVAGWDCCLVLVAGEPGLRFSGYGWFCGGTLCFSRRVWEKTKFRDLPVDEDHWFLEDQRGPRIRVREAEQYLLVRHGRNTWDEFATGQDVNDYMRSLAPYPKPLEEIVDAEAARFYRGIKLGKRLTRGNKKAPHH